MEEEGSDEEGAEEEGDWSALENKGDSGLGLCTHKVTGYDGEACVAALLAMFEGLLDVPTVFRAAQLYVLELTIQAPYFKAIGALPRDVKDAIEGRDRWFSTSPGSFFYMGKIAHGMHGLVVFQSSLEMIVVQSTLDHLAMPVVQAQVGVHSTPVGPVSDCPQPV